MVTLLNIKILISPNNEQTNERLFCIGYLIYGIIIFIIIGLSYKPKYDIEISHYATLMLLIRFAFRAMDLENTRAFNNRAYYDA